MKWLMSIIFLALLSTSTWTCTQDGKLGIAPENDLYISIDDVKERASTTMTEEEFHQIIDHIEGIYAPIVESHGKVLKIERNWKSGTVNAFAKQGYTWKGWKLKKAMKVSMFGGFARHPKVTNDGFAMVLCHELGHHLGGAPKRGWASNEGQSDYFASLKCFRKAYENDDNVAIIAGMDIDPFAQELCEQQWSSKNDQALCIRSSMAGLALANVLGDLSKSTAISKFNTPDPAQVNTTYNAHPKAQCRLDTYFQGALCSIDHTIDIPLKSATEGMCNREDGDMTGVRPRCWYSPGA